MSVPIARVGDIAEQIRGVTYAKGEAVVAPSAGYVALLRAGNITDYGLDFDGLIYVPTGRVASKQLVRSGDVVIAASSGSLDMVGKAAQADDDFTGGFGAFCKVLRPKNTVDARYFGHYFRTLSYRKKISALAGGANINNLRNEHLDGLKIPLPPLEEQRRIGHVLDSVDVLRAKRRHAIALLSDLAQSVFLDMFGDPKRNPHNLPVVQLKSLAKIGSGSTPSRRVSEYFKGMIPWVKTTEVTGNIIMDTKEKISEAARVAARCQIHPAGSIVVALYGQGKTRGQCAILGIAATTNQACAVIPPNPALYSTSFMFHQLRFSYARLRTMGRGGNQANLNLGMIGDFKVLAPPLSRQEDYARRVEVVDMVKSSHEAHLAELDALFASLQYRAFRGELCNDTVA